MQNTKGSEEPSPQFDNKNARNLQALTLYVYPKGFILEPSRPTGIQKRLIIDRVTGRLSELDLDNAIPDGYERKVAYSAYLGNITVQNKVFLLLVNEAIPVCKIDKKHPVFSVANLSFYAFQNEQDYNTQGQSNQNSIINHLNNIKKLLTKGYYFSFTYDLTLSKSRQSSQANPDMQYAWNGFILSDIFRFKITKNWFVPLIQGCIGSSSSSIGSKPIEFILITRRSCLRGGTRYHARGLDDAGNTANFCETEQIIYYGDYCCSFVILRGSVPIFWQQRGLTAETKITRSFELTNKAFLRHFKFLRENYGKVFCINLMAIGKSSEQMLTEAYETHIRANEFSDVKYEHFDFHGACKGNKFFNTNPTIERLTPIIQNLKFHVEDMKTGKKLMNQEGVFRISCLDCLDRTNVFSSKIAAAIFQEMMLRLNLDIKSMVFGTDFISLLDLDISKQPTHPFIIEFKHKWADNGDLISWHYAGTGSVISSVTRSGRETIFGKIDHGMKSMTRFYVGNFEDAAKQEAIDLLSGSHTDIVNVFGEEFDAAIKKREGEFATYSSIKVFLSTWNLGGFDPTSTDFELSPFFKDFETFGSPELVVLGFQEYISLSAINIMTNGPNSNQINKWVSVVGNALKKIDRYMLIKQISLVGILMLVFAKESIQSRIQELDADIVKTGVGGNFGNKGGVVVKLCVDDSSFAFINCHLEAAQGKNSTRLLNLIDIHEKAFQEGGVGKKKQEKIIRLDYRFLVGDMNFRVNHPNMNVRMMINQLSDLRKEKKDEEANKLFYELLSYDQLVQSKHTSEILEQYNEGKIGFLPTYKFDTGMNTYDSSKKQRTPSWTDRILFSHNFGKIEQLYYKRKDFRESDHRPVTAMFVVQVKKIDQAKKEAISKQVYETDTELKKTIQEEEKRASMPDDELLQLQEAEERNSQNSQSRQSIQYVNDEAFKDFFNVQ